MNKNMIKKDLGNELMLYDTDSDELHVFNSSARMIYQMLEQGKTDEEIKTELKKNFKIDESVDINNDIKKYKLEIYKKGLLK